jgi:phosphoribosylglycinamide formyltransferase-1
VAKASLVVLISGSGSNLQAIIDAIKDEQLDAEIKAVISNTASAGGLDRAAREGISTHVIDHKAYPSREAFDAALIEIIDPLQPDLVVLAGFMRILSDGFIKHFHKRLINIHPSLLPAYKGLNTHQRAIDDNETVHGASVHFVDIELDSGPVVIQATVPVLKTDTSERLAARVLEQEHKIYPLAINMITEGKLRYDNENLMLDDKRLVKPLLWVNDELITP